MMHKRAIGDKGEAIAEAYLAEKGYTILARQYRYKRYEIDLVALDMSTKELVFVEVKFRKSEALSTPEDAITPQKRAFLIRAAEAYLMETEHVESQCRFDVIAIVHNTANADSPIIRHYEDAFWTN